MSHSSHACKSQTHYDQYRIVKQKYKQTHRTRTPRTQSILARARDRPAGLLRLFTCRSGPLRAFLRSRLRATMTGTELLVTR